MICGTSTGGIIALGFLKNFTIKEGRDLYYTLGKKIFEYRFGDYTKGIVKTVIGEGDWCRTEDLESVLKEKLGTDLLSKYSHPKYPRVFTVATNSTDTNHPSPFLFRNYSVNKPITVSPFDNNLWTDGDSDIPLYEAGLGTSAAPTYFKMKTYQKYKFVDGGLVANNPARIAIKEARLLWPNRPIGCIVSLGTGERPKDNDNSHNILKHIKLLVNLVTDSTSIWKQAIDDVKKLNTEQPLMVRFSPNDLGAFPLDTTDEKVWQKWEEDSNAYMKTQGKELQRLADYFKMLNS